VAFSPDGSTLASGGVDGPIQLWNVANPASPVTLGPPLTGHTGTIESVAFRPTGGLILAKVSGSDDETIRIWNLNVEYAIDRICGTGANNLTAAQLHTDVPELPYRPPCT
jgi:WD40 repeat protein